MTLSREGWVLTVILVLLLILFGISMLASMYVEMRKKH